MPDSQLLNPTLNISAKLSQKTINPKAGIILVKTKNLNLGVLNGAVAKTTFCYSLECRIIILLDSEQPQKLTGLEYKA